MLAAIGRYYRWPKAEIERLTAREAAFWMGAAASLEERSRKEME